MKRIRIAVLSALSLTACVLASPAWAEAPSQLPDPIQVAASGTVDPLSPVRKLYPNLLTLTGSWGGCGQNCRTTSGASWPCGSMERPYFADNGSCTCYNMKGREPRCD